jgi:hypothetical protein
VDDHFLFVSGDKVSLFIFCFLSKKNDSFLNISKATNAAVSIRLLD